MSQNNVRERNIKQAIQNFLTMPQTFSQLTQGGNYTCYSSSETVTVSGQVLFEERNNTYHAVILHAENSQIRTAEKTFDSLEEAVQWTQLVCYTTVTK